MKKLIKFISIEDFKKILNREKDKKFKLAYVLAFGSGLRISEVIGYKGLSKKKDKKTGELIIEDVVIESLKREQVNLQEHQIKLFGKGGKERITVTSPWLTEKNVNLLPLKINRRTLQRRFSILCNKVLKKHMSFHTLRHGFGNYLVNDKNLPLPMVQGFMGHSRIDTTGIYTKANPKKAIETAWESF